MADIYGLEIRNQILLEGLKNSQSNDFDAFLRKLTRYISGRLGEEGETITTKKALRELLSDIKNFQVDEYVSYNAQFNEFLEELAIDQASFESDALDSYVVNVTPTTPTNPAILRALNNNIMSIENYSGEPLLEPFIRDYTDKQIQIIQTTIQQGFAQGKTTAQIAREIRGTRSLNYSDGIMQKVKNSNFTMVHTTIQHASTQGRLSTWEENDDVVIGYEWVSTLDSRTSQICRSLDGQTFKVGKGPLPPIHPNCRSTTVPVVDNRYTLDDEDDTRPAVFDGQAKQVSSSKSYYEVLKAQPASIQDAAIGPTRGKLLRNGGLSADEFAKLNLNKNFEPLTLDEMRTLRPDVFEKAGV